MNNRPASWYIDEDDDDDHGGGEFRSFKIILKKY